MINAIEGRTDYQKQAQDYLDKTGATIEVIYNRQGKYFDGDKEERDIYTITMKRGERSFTFEFGQSIAHSGRYWLDGYQKKGMSQGREVKAMVNTPSEHGIGQYIPPLGHSDWVKNKEFAEPTPYDILACLTKYDPGNFENFCGDFGYDTDSRRAEKTYQVVKNEYTNLCLLFTDAELEEMQEIS